LDNDSFYPEVAVLNGNQSVTIAQIPWHSIISRIFWTYVFSWFQINSLEDSAWKWARTSRTQGWVSCISTYRHDSTHFHDIKNKLW